MNGRIVPRLKGVKTVPGFSPAPGEDVPQILKLAIVTTRGGQTCQDTTREWRNGKITRPWHSRNTIVSCRIVGPFTHRVARQRGRRRRTSNFKLRCRLKLEPEIPFMQDQTHTYPGATSHREHDP